MLWILFPSPSNLIEREKIVFLCFSPFSPSPSCIASFCYPFFWRLFSRNVDPPFITLRARLRRLHFFLELFLFVAPPPPPTGSNFLFLFFFKKKKTSFVCCSIVKTPASHLQKYLSPFFPSATGRERERETSPAKHLYLYYPPPPLLLLLLFSSLFKYLFPSQLFLRVSLSSSLNFLFVSKQDLSRIVAHELWVTCIIFAWRAPWRFLQDSFLFCPWDFQVFLLPLRSL